MAKHAHEDLRRARIRASLAGRSIVDADGCVWRVAVRRGFLGRETLELVPAGSLAESFSATLTQTAASELAGWAADEARPTLARLSEEAEPLLARCCEAGEEQYRRGLLQALGAQGREIFRGMVLEKFDAIGELWAKERQQGLLLTSSGLLPHATRFKWELKAPRHTYTAFCLEYPPERRTIQLFGALRRIALPWLCFLVYFMNEAFYGLQFFYRPQPLDGEGAELFVPNLPNIYPEPERKYFVCMPRSIPVIRLTDPGWERTLMDCFWGSTFNIHESQFWDEAKARIPEVSSPERWEKLAAEDPAAMLRLPWKPLGRALGEQVRETFENHFLKVRGRHMIQERRKAITDLAGRFGEHLEEKLCFLAAHFTVPYDLANAAREFLKKKLEGVSQDFAASLSTRCNTIADKAAKTYGVTLEELRKTQARKEDDYVPRLDP